MKDGKDLVSFDFMVLNLSLSSLIEFSFLCFTVRYSKGSFAVGEQQWWTSWMSSCVSGVPQETCAVICCLWGRTGLLRSPPFSRSAKQHAPMERLVCAVLSLSVGGFPLVLLHLLTQNKSVSVHGQETTRLWRWAIEDTMYPDTAWDGSLARPGQQLNSGFPLAPLLESLRKREKK